MNTIQIVVTGLVAFFGGGILAWITYSISLRARNRRIIQDAESEAEVIKKDKILQAKEKFLQLRTEHENEINSRNAKIVAAENRIKQKETAVNQKLRLFAKT
jgi:ribonuclease Y